MMRFLLVPISLGLLILVAPAQAGQGVDNSRMPFPMLMEALFGQDRDARRPRQRVERPTTAARAAPPAARWNQTRPQAGPAAAQPAQPRRVSVPRKMDPKYERIVVPYAGPETPGSIVIDTGQRFLYLVQDDGTALRYGVGVGRQGFSWTGSERISRKAEWPDWRPPEEMKKRQPGLPDFMPGGPDNPLGARALYLGSTLYRIHGSNEPWTIGQAVSSGCIRMRNEDVVDLYDRVRVGARVVVM